MDEDRIRFVVGQAAGLIDWLEENGFEFGRPMSFDLIEGVDRFHYASNGKPTDLLYAKNQELGVEYWMETKATALLTDEMATASARRSKRTVRPSTSTPRARYWRLAASATIKK